MEIHKDFYFEAVLNDYLRKDNMDVFVTGRSSCWLHTGDIAYIKETGMVYILGRGHSERFGGGELYMMRMETKAVRVPGVQDGFFCIVPDKEHEGFFVPYLFIILDGSKTLDEVKAGLKEALEDYEYPVDIRVIEERPYFHFKTNRKELTEAILAENN